MKFKANSQIHLEQSKEFSDRYFAAVILYFNGFYGRYLIIGIFEVLSRMQRDLIIYWGLEKI
jgi:hypothetical protein